MAVKGAGEPLIIVLIVDVQQDSFIFYFQLFDGFRMLREEGAAAYIAFERHGFGEERPIEQDGVAAGAAVGGDEDLGAGSAVVVGQLGEGCGADQRLVGEDDEGSAGLRAYGFQASSQGGGHSLFVVRVDDYLEAFREELPPNGFGGGAQDEDDFVECCAADVGDGLPQHGGVSQAEELLRPAHPGGLARGQDDGGNLRLHQEIVGGGSLVWRWLTLVSTEREP